MKKVIFAFTLLFLFVSSAFAKTIPGDVLVIFENSSNNKVSSASLASDGEHSAYIASVASELNAEVAATYNALSENNNEIFALIHSDTKSEQELLKEVLSRSDVKGASLNHISFPAAKTPNDKYYSVYPDENGLLWGMKAIRANEVWDNTTGSSSVYVAVIDSGIEASHEDLASNIATQYCRGYDINGNSISDYSDVNTAGHGTHVSGIIGAVGDNEKGVAGVNWTTKIIMFKAYVYVPQLKVYGFPNSTIVAALNDIASLKKNNVNIVAVNMSLGGWQSDVPSEVSNSSDPYWAALKSVSDAGIVICVSAGNEGQAVGVPAPVSDTIFGTYDKGDYVYPASYRNIPNMIVVAAASKDVNGKFIRSAEGEDEANSNYSSTYVDVAAPGSHIVSTVPSYYEMEYDSERVEEGIANYASWPGTSMATPHVAGAVALLKAAYPDATGSQIKKAIQQGADSRYCKNDKNEVTYEVPGDHTTDNTSKYGFLDVKAAYELLPGLLSAQTKPSESDYTVETDVDSKYLSNSSSTPAEGWREVPIEISVNDNAPQVGDLFYVWLTRVSSSSVESAADEPYVSYVKTAGQLDIDVDDIYENDGVTKAEIT
ncbi:MAG: S8 family serine peptidase, partial [Synergistaceae bacterium]|nr:S8 family serine peptidase [Synergistaceae bacterium]